MMRATDRLERCGTLWVLVLCGDSSIGIGKTSNKEQYHGKIRSYAKRNGISDPRRPEIDQGFNNINKKTLQNAEGDTGQINNDHKSNNLISLTRFGLTLFAYIDNRPEIEREVKKSIGLDTDESEEPWPLLGDRDDPVVEFHSYSERPPEDGTEYVVEVIATFACPHCGNEVQNEYSVVLQDGIPINGWSRWVETKCGNCGQAYIHKCGDHWQPPEPID